MKELPDINVLPVHSVYLPVQDKKLMFSPYTIEQEKGIVSAIESKDSPAMIDNYKALIGECFHDPVDFETLSAMEFILMSVNLRCKSKGEVLHVTTKCKKCNHPIVMDIHLEDNIIVENQDVKKGMCEITKDLSFEVGPIKFDFLYQLAEIKTESDLILQTALHSINKVIWKKDIYPNLNPSELSEKIKFSHEMLKKIFNETMGLIRMKMMIHSTCDNEDCKNEENYQISDFLKFLT
jgi:hypothetical protein